MTNCNTLYHFPSCRVMAASAFLGVSAVVLGHIPAQSVMYNRDVSDKKALELARQPQFRSQATIDGCSAVLIAPAAALSAAHCVGYKGTGKVRLSWNGQTKTGTFWKHKSADLIVITVKKPFKNPHWTPPYAGRREKGQLIWKVGRGWFGILGPGSTKPRADGKFRAVSNRIEIDPKKRIPAVTVTELHYDFSGPPSQPRPGKTPTEYEGGTAPGDSGGPMYMQEDGIWYVVGVTSGPRSGFYADGRVSSCLPFIKQKTGHTWPTPTTTDAEVPAAVVFDPTAPVE